MPDGVCNPVRHIMIFCCAGRGLQPNAIKLRINASIRGVRSPRFILGIGSSKINLGLLNTLTSTDAGRGLMPDGVCNPVRNVS
jgi:hypothetical protein